MINLNNTHPECREGEVLLTNLSNESSLGLGDSFGAIRRVTKRKGIVAYSPTGEKLPNSFPVFVEKEELLTCV